MIQYRHALTRSTISTLVVATLCSIFIVDSARALSAREAAEFKQLMPTDRMIQVCSLKLENRISKETRYRHVDRVVLDAFSHARLADRTIRAKGAAFRNDGKWFKLQFRCAVTGDRLHVEAMEYEIVSTKPVPQKDWEAHWLFP
ncbi:DUF930 domain-containing protein [Aureimonas phyllosphaerae]|uniref:DUF930 domain-containing protein n=1 Tax=Aureimonas phyllosphaerae TaxID=1166078 RepID=UPI003A5C29CA